MFDHFDALLWNQTIPVRPDYTEPTTSAGCVHAIVSAFSVLGYTCEHKLPSSAKCFGSAAHICKQLNGRCGFWWSSGIQQRLCHSILSSSLNLVERYTICFRRMTCTVMGGMPSYAGSPLDTPSPFKSTITSVKLMTQASNLSAKLVEGAKPVVLVTLAGTSPR
jgi:hypothetical protein